MFLFHFSKVIVGSCVLLYVGLSTVRSYPQGYGGGHEDEEHVDYYVGIIIIRARYCSCAKLDHAIIKL